MMKAFDLVGTIHGREYSEHGEFVTADDYYHLMLHGEAVARLKLGLEEDIDRLKKENDRMKREEQNDAIAYRAVIEKQEELRVERDKLKSENEAMKAGIDPKWGLMDQSILVDYLREQTNFCAEKFDGMIQFAVDAANREYK